MPKVNLHVTKLEILQVDCMLLFKTEFYDTINNLSLTLTLNDCNLQFQCVVHQPQLYRVWVMFNHACKNVPVRK